MGKFDIRPSVSRSISSTFALELSSWLRYDRDDGLWGGESHHGCCSHMNAVGEDNIWPCWILVISGFENGERW